MFLQCPTLCCCCLSAQDGDQLKKQAAAAAASNPDFSDTDGDGDVNLSTTMDYNMVGGRTIATVPLSFEMCTKCLKECDVPSVWLEAMLHSHSSNI